MSAHSETEQRFLNEVAQYDSVIRRLCFMYSTPSVSFDDLYQETMVNLWRGFGSFRGDSTMYTWIYRVTINSCLSWLRRNHRYGATTSLDEAIELVPDNGDDERRRDLADMYLLISRLDPLEKAIVMMWLDENSYDEIAAVTGLSRAAVATRLHRIKTKLIDAEKQMHC